MTSVKDECLERMILFGERALQSAKISYLEHYHCEQNHQGLGKRVINPGEELGRTTGDLARRERLGGLVRYSYRPAA